MERGPSPHRPQILAQFVFLRPRLLCQAKSGPGDGYSGFWFVFLSSRKLADGKGDRGGKNRNSRRAGLTEYQSRKDNPDWRKGRPDISNDVRMI